MESVKLIKISYLNDIVVVIGFLVANERILFILLFISIAFVVLPIQVFPYSKIKY